MQPQLLTADTREAPINEASNAYLSNRRQKLCVSLKRRKTSQGRFVCITKSREHSRVQAQKHLTECSSSRWKGSRKDQNMQARRLPGKNPINSLQAWSSLAMCQIFLMQLCKMAPWPICPCKICRSKIHIAVRVHISIFTQPIQSNQQQRAQGSNPSIHTHTSESSRTCQRQNTLPYGRVEIHLWNWS